MDVESPITLSHTEHLRTSTTQSSLQAPPFECTQCNRWGSENARNLVVCIDGTSNEFGQNHTNVVKLFRKIDVNANHPEQFVYYIGGIGTDPRSSNTHDHTGKSVFDKLDMAIGWNVDKIIKEAYGWLAEKYRAGDRVYLFGFSRGAYQARVLAAMIHDVGLTTTSIQKQINRAYARYKAIYSGKPEARDTARKFKDLFSWDCLQRVHFVGVWDTVSSVGFSRGNIFLSASLSASHSCYFRHALALDERRVKFMPEYITEMNNRANHEKSEYIVTSTDAEHGTSHTSERARQSTVSDDGTKVYSERKSNIKEVWFPGCHSDVGGVDRSGRFYNAGNVSLSWMRREAEAGGLVLRPADTAWVPSDLDFGVSDSMTHWWWLVECCPVAHQVSYSGTGDNSQRWHLLRPRRIIPGQKVHASILYANAYKPLASLGEGFEIPIVHPELDTELDDSFWETGLFDAAAAQDIVVRLSDQQGVPPIYLDRLLFLLRFQEGKQCVRNVPDWQNKFLHLIHNHDCPALVRLVTIIAYYEASDAHPESPAFPYVDLSHQTLCFAKGRLVEVLSVHTHRDLPRVLSLLRPLTKHHVLREHILTGDVLEAFLKLLDTIIHQPGGNTRQAMDGLTCMLQCEHTQGIIVEKLGANLPPSNATRLSRILEVEDPHLLTAALRMVMSLARIPEGKDLCWKVKDRLRELAKTDKRLVGVLSVEILLVICRSSEQEPQSIRNANARANVAGALIRLSPDRRGSADGEAPNVYPGLRHLFGIDATELSGTQKKLIMKLKGDVQKGNAWKRTAATLALLNLCDSCETGTIRTFLREIDLLGVFISQLRCKDSALLAAHALATCLKYGDMKESVKDNELLPRNIVGMLRLDYFDDAVGPLEGFQVFEDLMQHDVLRKTIKNYDITEVLSTKLAKDMPKETRTGLICLDVFRKFDKDGPWTEELVTKSLDHLRKPDWKTQKTGVIILSALAQTEHGAATINPRIGEIVEMLLPEGYFSHQPTTGARSPSSIMGPACALRILTQNELLRNTTRKMSQYGNLKELYSTGALVDEMDTSAWRLNTPNRGDVIGVLDKMIKAVDEEPSEEGLTSIGNAVPHIEHWDRLRDKTMGIISVLPALLGVSALAIPAAAVAAPVYLSVQVIKFLKNPVRRYQDYRVLIKLRRVHAFGAARPERQYKSDSGGGEELHDGERSDGVETYGGDAETMVDVASP